MFLQYLGHAGWLFGEDGWTLVCDPWQSSHGAFYAGWFPFPANDHVPIPSTVDALYLSHAHEDHFHPETLERFARDTRILIADFLDPVLYEGLTALGFTNIQRLSDGETTTVGSLSLQIFRDEDSGMYHDSALVVRSRTATILNLNDCRLSAEYVAQLDRVDVLLGQFSGANWYPLAYDYPAQQKKVLGAAKRRRGLERLAHSVALSQAAYTIPCAGPPAFLDPLFASYNDIHDSDENPFPMMETAVAFLEQKGHQAFLSMPGDMFEVNDGKLSLQSRTLSVDEVYGNREKYLRQYAEQKQAAIMGRLATLPADPLVGERLQQEFRRIIATSKVFVPQVRAAVRFRLLGVRGGDLLLDCREGQVPRVAEYQGEPFQYSFTVDARLVADLLRQPFINFEYVFLSMRLRAWRDPDVFNDALFALLVNFDDRRLRQAEQEAARTSTTTGGVFELVSEGARYLVQRRCPHLQADLSVVGQVHAGILTCPRHGWQFRLSDGVCLNVSAAPLFVQAIEETTGYPDCSSEGDT